MTRLEEIQIGEMNAVQHLDELGASIRFSAMSPTMKRNRQGEFEPDGHARRIAEIIDRTTGEAYATGISFVDEREATILAIQNARNAPKPLTKAQKTDPAFLADKQRIADLEAEVQRLRAAAAAGKASTTKTKKNTEG